MVALQARSDKKKSESLGGKSNRAETKSNRAETKSNRAETDNLCAIKLFLYEIRKRRLAIRKELLELCHFFSVIVREA